MRAEVGEGEQEGRLSAMSGFPPFLVSLSPHLTPLPHVPSSFPSQPHSPRIVKTSAPLQENIHRCPPLLHPRLSHPNLCLPPPFPLLCPQNLASPHAHQKQNLMVSGLPLIPSGGISYHTHTHTHRRCPTSTPPTETFQT